MLVKLQVILASALAAVKALPAQALAAAKPQSTAEYIRLAIVLVIGAKLSSIVMIPVHLVIALAKLLMKLL